MSEQPTRVRSYISALELALKEVKARVVQSKEVNEVIRLAELYLEDAKYYLGLGDYLTSASCVAYAEGLIDALRMLGLTEFSWRKPNVYKVLVAGTFDILHPGHLHFLNKAFELGLPHVVISRDINVLRNKGRPPVMNEQDRLLVVSSLKPVYRAVLGDLEDHLKPLLEIRPDIVLLGPDQPVDENNLVKELEKRGLPSTKVVRVKDRLNDYSSTKIIRKACNVINDSTE
ncbi:MAG: DUF357 domain-containing protein [Sulfolobales archaeon]